MPSYSRELTLLGLLGATLWLPECSQLTKVDWTAIRPAGGMSNGNGGASGGAGEAGSLAGSAEAGEGGISGAVGEGGAAGEAEVGDTGGGGVAGNAGGTGGVAGSAGIGGTGGTAGMAGGSAGGGPLHPTCRTAPTPPTAAPDLSNALVFFDGGAGNGKRGGRAMLDSSCKTTKVQLGLPQSEALAVISVSQTDQIFEMPERYKFPRATLHVVSPLGIEFAPSWNDVWRPAGAPPTSLVCAGVMPASVTTWLTGSGNGFLGNDVDPLAIPKLFGIYEFAGEIGSENKYSHACDEWSLGTDNADVKASVGSTIALKDGGADGYPYFIRYRLYSCEDATSHVLCMAYNRTP